jgi:hypothetical protein
MVLLQQLLNNANFHAMESLLERLLDQDSFADYELGLTCLLVWLYERNGKHEEAYQLLASKGTASTRVERLLLAEFKLKLGRYTDALVDYEWLVEDDNTDSKAVAGYVLCLSQTEPYKAFEMLGSLKSGMIPETINEDELEVLPGKVTHQVEKVVKQRKKKVKQLPKNYNPDVQPDPGIFC